MNARSGMERERQQIKSVFFVQNCIERILTATKNRNEYFKQPIQYHVYPKQRDYSALIC